MRKKIIAIGLGACIFGLTGCKDPQTADPTTEPVTASAETTVSNTESAAAPEQETAAAPADTTAAASATEPTTREPKVIPTTEPDTRDPMVSTRDASGYRKHKEFSLFDFEYHYDNPEDNFHATLLIPQIYTKDKALYKQINDSVIENSEANFRECIVLENLEVTSYYEIMTENEELISYYMTRRLHHLDAEDGLYREYDEMKSAFTMEVRTGKIFCLEDVYGMEQAAEDIRTGNYSVISGDASAFSAISDEQLAVLYSKYTTVTKDDDHKYDFYLKDGKVCVLIWVGQKYGGYVRLQLGDSKLSVSPAAK
ncbi:MAG: hypothetical protein J6T47_01060 [Lachnospiraceae bacterium]|nr:hypothetical protein [Lachnospiraceae bacterium]